MFALTEVVKEKLFALADANGSDVFHQCFENWQNVAWLFAFFEANPDALNFYGVDKKTAVELVLKEADDFFNDILDIAEGKSESKSLDNVVFKPLHAGDDFDLPIIETRAYGTVSDSSFLRLYAIRLNDGAYIVIGGLIKTTKALQDSTEGRQILKKLKDIVKILRKHNLFDAIDIGVFIV